MMIYGITPGPALITEHPTMFWGLIMSFWVGNIMLLILNIPLIGIWVRMLTLPSHLLFPAVLVFICIALYRAANSLFDVYIVLLFVVVVYFLRPLNYTAASLLLGFFIGP